MDQRIVQAKAPTGAPEPNPSATSRCEAYLSALRLMGVRPKSVEKIDLGGWRIRWRDGADRWQKTFFNDPTQPELLLLNEAKVTP
ncbi:MAG: hypothetical protein KY468_04800 [Armatimonadetes bacterium]|nr:hypothetical protein [Armatimonadota bacterium]